MVAETLVATRSGVATSLDPPDPEQAVKNAAVAMAKRKYIVTRRLFRITLRFGLSQLMFRIVSIASPFHHLRLRREPYYRAGRTAKSDQLNLKPKVALLPHIEQPTRWL